MIIASTPDASRNRLSTGTLSATDLTNAEQYRASSVGLSLGLSGVGSIGRNGAGAADAGRQDTKLPGVPIKGLGTLSAGLPTALGAHGGQTGTTTSAIAPGAIAITSGDAASLATAATIGRDTGIANAGALVQRFDANRRAEIDTSFAATRELANQTATSFQNRGADEQRLRDQAKDLAGTDPSAAAAGQKRLPRRQSGLRRPKRSGTGRLSVWRSISGGNVASVLVDPQDFQSNCYGNCRERNHAYSQFSSRGRLDMQLAAEQAAGVRAPTALTSFSDHAESQILGRDGGVGVSRSALQDAFVNSLKTVYQSPKYGPTFQYAGKNATVAVNADGKVTTGWATNSRD